MIDDVDDMYEVLLDKGNSCFPWLWLYYSPCLSGGGEGGGGSVVSHAKIPR